MTHKLSRRDANALLLVLGSGTLLACRGGETSAKATPKPTTSDTGTAPEAGAATAWASGGTKAMTDKASYPDPFATAVSSCVLSSPLTEGPCIEAADRVRVDVSEGYGGLPMRLSLRVVDSACKPLAGAKVKIWHTQLAGSYSGDTPNNAMCLKDPSDSTRHYFRGVQTTDADGRVAFDSCFPGWYPGRAIHIHYTVTVDGKAFSSQLFFDQELVNDVFASHPEYKGFGAPDTSNATDGVAKGNVASFLLMTSRMKDGALLAASQLVVA